MEKVLRGNRGRRDMTLVGGQTDESRNLNQRGLWKSQSTAGAEIRKRKGNKTNRGKQGVRAPFRCCQSFLQGVNKILSKIKETQRWRRKKKRRDDILSKNLRWQRAFTD